MVPALEHWGTCTQNIYIFLQMLLLHYICLMFVIIVTLQIKI